VLSASESQNSAPIWASRAEVGYKVAPARKGESPDSWSELSGRRVVARRGLFYRSTRGACPEIGGRGARWSTSGIGSSIVHVLGVVSRSRSVSSAIAVSATAERFARCRAEPRGFAQLARRSSVRDAAGDCTRLACRDCEIVATILH